MNKKILLRLLTIGLVTITTTSCAIRLRAYEPPIEGAVAFLSVANNAGKGLPAGEEVMFAIATFDQAETCKGRRIIHGAAKQVIPSGAYIKLSATHPSSIGMYYTIFDSHRVPANVYDCVAIINFTPIANQYYRATFSATDTACQIALRVSDNQAMQNSSDAPFRPMKKAKPIDENSDFCEAN